MLLVEWNGMIDDLLAVYRDKVGGPHLLAPIAEQSKKSAGDCG